MFPRKLSRNTRTPRRPAAPSARLVVERLESREVPATIQPLTEPETSTVGPDAVFGLEPLAVGPQGSPWASFSADGRYLAFEHDHGIFVRDRLTGATNRVDIAVDGSSPNGASQSAAISADGRFVVFWSWASNLVPDDTNNLPDVFVRDRRTGTTILASVAADGSQLAINDPGNLSISADGQFVAFDGIHREKINTEPPEPPLTWPPDGTWAPGGPLPVSICPGVVEQEQGQVYLFNQGSGTASLIGLGYESLISASGLFIAYANEPNDAGAGWTWYDRESDATRVVDPPWQNTIPGTHTHVLWISADGREVGLQRNYSPLGSAPLQWRFSGDGTYIYNVQTRESSNFPLIIESSFSVSADHRYIAFEGIGAFIPGASSPNSRVFILDRQTGSYATVGEGLEGGPFAPVISPDGQSVVFWNVSIIFLNLAEATMTSEIFLYTRDNAPARAPQSAFGPIIAFALPHSRGTAAMIAWDLTGDGTADFVILTRRVHQRLNVTAFDMTARKAVLHFGLTRPRQMPQLFSTLVHLNRDSLLGLLSAAKPRPVEPSGLFATGLSFASA
jgi:hypothetical protein